MNCWDNPSRVCVINQYDGVRESSACVLSSGAGHVCGTEEAIDSMLWAEDSNFGVYLQTLKTILINILESVKGTVLLLVSMHDCVNMLEGRFVE